MFKGLRNKNVGGSIKKGGRQKHVCKQHKAKHNIKHCFKLKKESRVSRFSF